MQEEVRLEFRGYGALVEMEAGAGVEPTYMDLQSSA